MKNIKCFGICVLLVVVSILLVNCGGSATPPSGSVILLQSPNSGSIYLENSDYSGLQNIATKSYYLQLNSDSPITSVSSSSTAWRGSAYPSCDIDNYKCIEVNLEQNSISSVNDLSVVLTVTYANGSKTKLPLSGNMVRSGSGLYMSLPTNLVPNQDGYAYGTMTVLNTSDEAESIGNIDTGIHENVNFEFIPNCDGAYGNVVNAHSTCSVAFVYQAFESNVSFEKLDVQVPFTKLNGGEPEIKLLSTSSDKPAQQSDPKGYVSYSGNGVSLANSNTTVFIVQNIGNGVIPSISLTGLPNGVTTSNTCLNVLPNSTCSVTLTKSSPITSDVFNVVTDNNTIAISLSGQDLAVTPSSLDFGANYAGTPLTKVVTVMNNSALAVINGLTIGDSGNSAYTIDSSSCSSSLAPLMSCQVIINYNTPNEDNEQNTSFIVSAPNSGSGINIALKAASLKSNWSNIILNSSSYTDNVGDDDSPTTISSLSLSGDGNSIMFGNVNNGNDNIGRHLWNYSASLESYNRVTYLSYVSTPSVVSSMMFADDGTTFIGAWNGTFFSCSTNSCSEETSVSPKVDGAYLFGVSGIAAIDATHAVFGWSTKPDRADVAVPGKLFYWNGSVVESIVGIESGVGKFASDDNNIYVPVYSNQISVVVVSKTQPNQIAVRNMATNLEENERFTVLYQESGVLYAGTNFSNLYRTTLPITNNSQWVKLNYNSCLSGDCNEKEFPTMVVGLQGYQGKLYVALANPLQLVDSGKLYRYDATKGTFAVDYSYTDVFGITGIVRTLDDRLYVSSARGFIYTLN